jgi:hypothetical protein
MRLYAWAKVRRLSRLSLTAPSIICAPHPRRYPNCPIDGAQISIGRPRGTASVTAGFLPCRVSDASRSSAWHHLSWAGMISCSLFVRSSVF